MLQAFDSDFAELGHGIHRPSSNALGLVSLKGTSRTALRLRRITLSTQDVVCTGQRGISSSTRDAKKSERLT